MITIKNYFTEVEQVDFTALPEVLRKSHEYVVKATNNGQSWKPYESSESVKKTIDIYLQKLNELTAKKTSIKKTVKAAGKQEKVAPKRPIKQHQETIKPVATLVERVPEELKFIKRFMALVGKPKTKEQLLRFINALQKAMVEKRLRKTSPYADKILFIQDKILRIYNEMRSKVTVELKDDTREEFKALVGEEKVYPSINFIKRYISMNEKPGVKEKAKNLLKQINNALDKGKVTDNDPYTSEILDIKRNLSEFINSKSNRTLRIERSTLNGLEAVLGCACQQPYHLGNLPPVMNSVDFAKVQFNTIGLRGKWHELIGDPSSNFTAMVFGKPKMGKSFLCIEFAGYLARNHGKVLYVAKEEGLDLTLQNKLQETGVQHPDLFVSSELPANLSAYDFIFLDSVSKLGLTPADLTQLKKNNPSKSFVFIFQTTKDGKFRGENIFQHDVDVVIEVPKKGKAVQMGRFNQGGEMEIFRSAVAA